MNDDYGTILFCFNNLIEILNNRSSEYRKILHEASDIMDDETSRELWYSARKKISAIHDLITKAEALKEEILNADVIEFDPDVTEAPAEQSPADEEAQNPELKDEHWKPLGTALTKKKVKKISFKNRVYAIDSFAKGYIKICELLYAYDKDKFEQMVNDEYAKGNKIKLFSRNDNYRYSVDKRNYFRKMNNADIYIWLNNNSNDKTKNIFYMLNYFGLPADTVKLYIK